MKKIKLFPKTFLYTIVLMLMIILIAFSLLYFLVPPYYRSMKDAELHSEIELLTRELTELENAQMISVLQTYAMEKQLGLTLTDDDGNIIYSNNYGFSVGIVTGENGSNTAGDYPDKIIEMETMFESDTIELSKRFKNVYDRYYELRVILSLQPVDEASRVILSVMPIAIGICLIISAIFAFVYSKKLTVPIKSISKSTTDMLSLSKDISCVVNTRDEIGVLAENVNSLYLNLLKTIESLKKEISERSDIEKSKLDFMRTASHELKTPLTAVSCMLEGMISDIGVYKDHKTYLTECKQQIDSLTELVKDIIDTARFDDFTLKDEALEFNISDIVLRIVSTFEIIAKSSGVRLHANLDTPINVKMSEYMLAKAFSNIISNAVNYTVKDGSVSVITEENKLIVENDCEPLTADELSRIYEPFYRPDFSRSQNAGGNGIGLYLVNRIFEAHNLRYEFKPSNDKSGMIFTVWFNEG